MKPTLNVGQQYRNGGAPDGGDASGVEMAPGVGAAASPSRRSSQRQFVARNLPAICKMNPALYTECFVQPALQYFLATLCDMRVEPHERTRLGLRYVHTPEVRGLLRRLQKGKKLVNATGCRASANTIVSALKEILSGFPGGVFADISEEAYSISLNSPLSMTILYLHGLLETLPYFLRQFVYLVCRSLRNLVQQSSGGAVSGYTDLLLLFTPALFPSAVGDLPRFLRAARLTLVMVDACEQVFQPLVLDVNGNAPGLLSDDELFFHRILASLQRLQSSMDDDDAAADSPVETLSDTDDWPACRAPSALLSAFYQFTYVDAQ